MASQYLPFGTAGGANVMSYAGYNALPARTTGFTAGTALSVQLNTVWRQSSVASAALALFASSNAGVDLNDDGDVPNFADVIEAAVNALVTARNDTTPTGSVIHMTGLAGMTRPTVPGYVYANGANVSRTGIYAALWAYYGSPNTGDGSTTWTLPDFRGVVERNIDDGRGIDEAGAGRTPGSFQDWSTARPKMTTQGALTVGGGSRSLTGATTPNTVGFARVSKSGESVTTVGLDNTQSGFETDVANVVAGDFETRMANIAVWPFLKL